MTLIQKLKVHMIKRLLTEYFNYDIFIKGVIVYDTIYRIKSVRC